jgi:hypothetical protein
MADSNSIRISSLEKALQAFPHVGMVNTCANLLGKYGLCVKPSRLSRCRASYGTQDVFEDGYVGWPSSLFAIRDYSGTDHPRR